MKIFKKHLATPYAFFMLIFTIIPLLLIVWYAFTEYKLYGQLSTDFTLKNVFSLFTIPENLKALYKSLYIGFFTTLICFLLGYPIAYILSRPKYKSKTTLILLFILPVWINFLLRTLATRAFFNTLDIKLGIGTVMFGMIYNFLPFMILPLYTTLSNIDNSLLEASSDLGASPIKSFFKITLPLSIPGIISGVTMVFTPVITTFVISDLLSFNKVILIGNIINTNVASTTMNLNNASGISIILLIFIAISMVVINKFDKKNNLKGGGLW